MLTISPVPTKSEKTIKLHKYRVNSGAESTMCQYCGGPIDTGDSIYMYEVDHTEYCCTGCAKRSNNAGKAYITDHTV